MICIWFLLLAYGIWVWYQADIRYMKSSTTKTIQLAISTGWLTLANNGFEFRKRTILRGDSQASRAYSTIGVVFGVAVCEPLLSGLSSSSKFMLFDLEPPILLCTNESEEKQC